MKFFRAITPRVTVETNIDDTINHINDSGFDDTEILKGR